jgi:SAM-dependent methyltransferase
MTHRPVEDEGPLRFVCPRCKGPLTTEPAAYRCPRCARRYPIVLGIPDFRLFPDPYISIEDDYSKAEALMKRDDSFRFEDLVSRYWAMTPGVPAALVAEYVRGAMEGERRGRAALTTILSADAPARCDRLLDIGCGTAGFLAAAAPEFGWAVGLDIASRWLVVARKRLEEAGVRNVTLVCGCAEHLPFPDGVFDLVAGEDVLDHVKDPQAFLREGARVLAPERGVFYFSTPNRYSLGPDPHVWVWGVGFLPPGLRDRYVRLRRGIPYGPIHPVSYLQMRRLLRGASLGVRRLLFPSLHGVEGRRLTGWQRAQVRVYEIVRTLPVLREGLRLFGPGFQVMCRPAPAARSLHPRGRPG